MFLPIDMGSRNMLKEWLVPIPTAKGDGGGVIVSLENERAKNEKEDIVEKVIRSEEINGELVRSSRKG